MAALLGARAGLKVSSEQLFRLSILVQLVLSLGWIGSALIQMWLRMEGAGTVTPIGVVSLAAFLPLVAVVAIHIYNFVLISRATATDSEYPWDVLKWTFLFATLAFCTPFVVELVLVSQVRFSIGSLLSSMIFFVPPCLQIVLLWWPRAKGVTAY
jgi:hypothetical protein